jgi:hypothetical protein
MRDRDGTYARGYGPYFYGNSDGWRHSRFYAIPLQELTCSRKFMRRCRRRGSRCGGSGWPATWP